MTDAERALAAVLEYQQATQAVQAVIDEDIAQSRRHQGETQALSDRQVEERQALAEKRSAAMKWQGDAFGKLADFQRQGEP